MDTENFNLCDHSNSEEADLTEEFKGEIFHYRSLQCKDCGAVLHGKDYSQAYMAWLNSIYEEKKDKFLVKRIKIPAFLDHFINKVKDRHPDAPDAAVIKALVFVYKDVISANSVLSEAVEEVYSISALSDEPNRETSIRFKPSVLLSIKGAAEFEGLSIAQYISEASKRVASTMLSKEEKNDFSEKITSEFYKYILLSA